jgi:hypothetical protein
MEVREATAEIEPASGAVVQAFTTGTVVQVFLLAGSAPTEAWSNRAQGEDRWQDDGGQGLKMSTSPRETFEST